MVLAPQEFRDIADGMSDSVLDACRANAVLFSFETPDANRRFTFGYGAQSDAKLMQSLEDFCFKKSNAGLAYEPGGLSLHTCDSGSSFVLVLIPLRAEGHSYGAMALAISRENWAEQRAFAACSQVAHLVSMNLRSAQIRAKLEADLKVLSQHTRQLQRQSEIDSLTEVENKASFESHARSRLTDSGQPAALVVIDLDYFKEVNDVYGHQFGDTYLQTIARAVCGSLPKGTLVGRIGGDEFAALIDLPTNAQNSISDLMQGLRAAVQRDVSLLGKSELGQMSIGVSLYPEHARDYSTLFALADSALYRSKDRARNVTTIHGHALDCGNQQAPWRNGGCVHDLKQITPHFQPIIEFETGICSGVEALARSRGRSEGAVTKAVAWMFRDHKVAPRLTRHILSRSLRSLAALPSRLTPDLWFNLTKFDLLDADFVPNLQTLLDCYGFGWDRIVAEVHEDVILGDRGGQMFQSLQDMRRRGGRVALDDFGSGYAGLKHMRDWPVDIIKIDQSFIRNIEHDAHAKVVVEALMMITRSRGIDVVAEGLETNAQVAAINDLGCKYGQGFVFDAALPAADLPDKLVGYGPAAQAASHQKVLA